MPVESRFRLERPFDVAEAFSQRQSGSLAVLIDQRVESLESPARRRALATPVHQRRLGLWAAGGDGLARSRMRTPRAAIGQEIVVLAGSSSRRRGRGSNSMLPSWYPRTPLGDITAITRAIERRRARLGEENGETAEGQFPSLQVQDASPEHQVLAATPSTIKKRPCPPSSVLKVHKILLEVANQPDEGEFVTPQKKLLNSPSSVLKVHKILLEVANQPDEGEFVTPQKKLLNSIDKVEKVIPGWVLTKLVLEELQRLKRTPSAKKAERERKVRTLMSMR